MRPTSFLATALLAGLAPLNASAGPPAEVEVYDRTAGRILPVYWHGGERHVAGEPGHEYELRILNRSNRRLLAVASVDGVNVVSGRTAAADQAGYVIDAGRSVGIEGWRKSLEEVAAFYFTSLPDSYAARTGRPDNVGVIGVALFHEKPAQRPRIGGRSSASGKTPAAPAAREADARAAAPMEDRLGTGHGQRLDSAARYTRFDRASDVPDAVVRIFYDSRRNLVAQGVIPRPHYAHRHPDPFPGGFVPDP